MNCYEAMFACSSCDKKFSRIDNLRRHERTSCPNTAGVSTHPPKKLKINPPSSTSLEELCHCCNIMVPKGDMSSHRRTLKHRTSSCVELSSGVKVIHSAFKCRIISYRVNSDNETLDYKLFFSNISQKVIALLENVLGMHVTFKANMEVFGRYIHQTQDIVEIKSFNTPNQIIARSSNLEHMMNIFKDVMISQTTEFEERDSGWALEKILFLEVNVNRYSPLKGCSYIKLPKFIENKKAVINVVNQDLCCFAWAVTSALYPAASNVQRVSSYPHFATVLNLAGISFPMSLRDIPMFEIMNDCSINVYGLEKFYESDKLKYEIVGPLHYSRNRLGNHVNLLFLTDDKGNNHYCWIKDLSRLVSSQISSHEHKYYFCDGCLLYFENEISLLRHRSHDCNHVYSVLPTTNLKLDKFGKTEPENILKFENFEKQLQVPFIVYADFESILKPMDSCQMDPDASFTHKTYKHEPYSFAYLIKCSFDDSLTKFVTYRGKNAAELFVSKIEDDLTKVYNEHLKRIVPMHKLTRAEQFEFDNASACGICEVPFVDGDIKVRDHCHLTGKKRYGAAHSICNLNFKIPYFIPIVFHNLSGYDCHLFIKELFDKGDKVEVIPQTKEKYVSFTRHLHVDNYIDRDGQLKNIFLKLRFIDSFRFMADSLQNLGESLKDDQFPVTRKYFPDDEKFNLMRKKGVFPYSFVNNLVRLDNEDLPSQMEFYDSLNERHISDEEYGRAKLVWNSFNCCTLGDYSDIYLKSDVLLLCDVFENFRNISLDKYKLDPAHYYTSPGLSWDAMLRYTKVKLELLTDIDMLNFFKKGIRGGISQCSERKHIANNILLPNFDRQAPSSFIMYLDATNLYGHSMSQTLPTDGFEWLSPTEIGKFDVMSTSSNDAVGYVLEVDIHYPESLHDLHSDLPYLVESIIPPESKSKIPKLIPNLNNKKKYIVHYVNLKQAIENGLILVEIHRILKFNQSPWLKKYIDLNTEMRNKATSKFENRHYKGMVNSVYGKTMENVDKRCDIKLLTHWENIRRTLGASAYIARPNFKTVSRFNENFVAIHMGKVKINYDKPMYLGFCILELSKTVIYDFFYGCIKKEFGRNASLLYTDTDSLILKVETENFYDFMKNNPDSFDTSNYKEGNCLGISIGKSVLGRMKDEFPSDPIMKFYGTGAKAYYVQSLKNEVKKAKGIKKSVIEKQIHSEDYRKIVERGGLIFRKMNTFVSELHDIYTILRNKIALSSHDDKRFVIPNTTKTLPWGHKEIIQHKVEHELHNNHYGNGNLDDLIKGLEGEM